MKIRITPTVLPPQSRIRPFCTKALEDYIKQCKSKKIQDEKDN